MKAFLEEYGLVVVIVIVIGALLIAANTVSTVGTASLENTVTKFSNHSETRLDSALNGTSNTETPTE